ncbi:hypothetical protein C8F04DRAFT_1344253 [Mycena alexandri]|uniref:Uncharacterized protein n=1 Tax=Mycena alexandri TaxID=1745969 RepID=A0AAD6X7W7_9AGAR|nr:hypothetical protein C8F04DRAFT_1344253 [Mycena alexandri]
MSLNCYVTLPSLFRHLPPPRPTTSPPFWPPTLRSGHLTREPCGHLTAVAVRAGRQQRGPSPTRLTRPSGPGLCPTRSPPGPSSSATTRRHLLPNSTTHLPLPTTTYPPRHLRLAAPQGNPSSRLANPSSSPVPDPAAVSTSRAAASAVSAPATPVGSVPYSPAGCAYAMPPPNGRLSHLRVHMTPLPLSRPAGSRSQGCINGKAAFPTPWLTPSVILRPTFHHLLLYLLSPPFTVRIHIHGALRHPSVEFREDFDIILAMPFSPPSARSCRSPRRVIRRVDCLLASICTAPRSRADGHSPHALIFPSAFDIIRYLATVLLPTAAASVSSVRRPHITSYPETPTSFAYAMADVYNAALVLLADGAHA